MAKVLHKKVAKSGGKLIFRSNLSINEEISSKKIFGVDGD